MEIVLRRYLLAVSLSLPNVFVFANAIAVSDIDRKKRPVEELKF